MDCLGAGCIAKARLDSETGPQGCGQDVRNWRSGQGRPVCQPRCHDDSTEEQQPESMQSIKGAISVSKYFYSTKLAS
ncbi:MAG: hypothetical protein HKP41_15205 [Desulfobacterales bacterium]|nr:hypothetical protein [Deltaproteobacteria bacterium]MBT8362335.1 hypothetical protein [Deltaproteobacteria bacterium]NNK95697.1 hypothetical protein [Desulfobacterales bacterium]